MPSYQTDQSSQSSGKQEMAKPIGDTTYAAHVKCPNPGEVPKEPVSGPTDNRPVKLTNVQSKCEWYEHLHTQAEYAPPCSSKGCLGSVVQPHPIANSEPRSKSEVLRFAEDFLEQYYTSIKRSKSPAHTARWEQIKNEVNLSGTYQLTETELVFGAKVAWRNASRCINRIQWSKLQVFDCRTVTTTGSMFEAICNHIKYSTNKGNIRSAITVFPQRTDGRHDYRIWNSQLVSYAGYKNPDGTITGDPIRIEFTEVCMKLGWRGKGTNWDILPLIIQANGHDPEYFELPPELVLEVEISHPTYEWFSDLGLRWYALPAVSSMMLDCGGVQFTACPFNGWYMLTEIGVRDLCDLDRYNVTPKVAEKMGIPTNTNMSLWKDRACMEVLIAVLHSFQKAGVTIMDHHTATEAFMRHLENEQKARGGCPSDWVWIVPPSMASLTPVFHQEMMFYTLFPSYEKQDEPWKTYEFKKGKTSESTPGKSKVQKKFHFKQIARAVKFTSKLFGQALSKRIKATILFATETGKSETYAHKLADIFGHAFHSEVIRMDEYDMSNIEHEAILMVVTSTFGNGDPPENGQSFAKNLFDLKMEYQRSKNGSNNHKENSGLISSASFIKANSLPEQPAQVKEKYCGDRNPFSDNFGPLSNVRFAVFALGSSAYPNFCAFGIYVDNLLGELGGERMLKIAKGDEMMGQEQTFKTWAPEAFKVACETFCLEMDDTAEDINQVLQDTQVTASTVRMVESREKAQNGDYDETMIGLSKAFNRKVAMTKLLAKKNLHKSEKAERATMLFELKVKNIPYQPGDHVGIFACNRKELVDGIIKHLEVADPDKPVQLQFLKEVQSQTGVDRIWVPHEKLPCCSVRTLFTRYMDITTPPTPNLLRFFQTWATNSEDKKKLSHLIEDNAAYEDWRHFKFPHLLEVLQEFPSVKPPAALLASQLSMLQPRFYSISSSPLIFENQIHLTIAIVTYRTQDGKGPMHHGVCSTYLQNASENDTIYIFHRTSSNFHLPEDRDKPVILVGPGTGIAPFRGFWQHRAAQKQLKGLTLGKMILFFGCRTRSVDLYAEEKNLMLKEGVLSEVHLALSREQSVPKTYVQDLMRKEATKLFKLIVSENGHFYVCGDCKMAEDVYQTLRTIIQEQSGMTNPKADSYLLRMRDENRYHEDIFGITLRTAEVHCKSRESARIRMASESVP